MAGQPAIRRTLSRLFLPQKSPQPLVDFGCIPRPCHLSVMQTFDGVQGLGNCLLDARQLLFELAIHRPS
jgi:hypothetical protein